MNFLLIQFPVICFILLALLVYFKPWRMRVEASAVVVTLSGMAYVLSLFTMGLSFPSGALHSYAPYAVWIVLASFIFPILVYLGLWIADMHHASKMTDHPTAERILGNIGKTILGTALALVAIAKIQTFLPHWEPHNIFQQISLACMWLWSLSLSLIFLYGLLSWFDPDALIVRAVRQHGKVMLRWWILFGSVMVIGAIVFYMIGFIL